MSVLPAQTLTDHMVAVTRASHRWSGQVVLCADGGVLLRTSSGFQLGLSPSRPPELLPSGRCWLLADRELELVPRELEDQGVVMLTGRRTVARESRGERVIVEAVIV